MINIWKLFAYFLKDNVMHAHSKKNQVWFREQFRVRFEEIFQPMKIEEPTIKLLCYCNVKMDFIVALKVSQIYMHVLDELMAKVAIPLKQRDIK